MRVDDTRLLVTVRKVSPRTLPSLSTMKDVWASSLPSRRQDRNDEVAEVLMDTKPLSRFSCCEVGVSGDCATA